MNILLVDLPLAFAGMFVGFYLGSIYFRSKNETALQPSGENPNGLTQVPVEADDAEYDAERANMAALQLRDLAKNVATDVGEHNSLVTAISEDLGAMERDGSQVGVSDAIAKILKANEKLQTRLADAEQKIQTQAEELRAQESEARTDSLTQIANRRAFDDAIQKNLDSFQAEKKPFSLLIFDVDHFKKFNDTHGHQAGDEVLRRVAKTLEKTVKTADVPCRYGGEEFAVVMQNTRIDSARIASERIRKAIEGLVIEFEGKSLRVTASIGVAEISSSENSVSLIRRADDSVYAAKKAGRNRSYWNDGTQCLPVLDTSETASSKANSASASESQSSNPQAPVKLADLPRRRAFCSELTRRISESHRYGISLSVMHLRVADYSQLADEFGQAVGEMILESVAQFIGSTMREMDLLGKLQSGDFVVMLPGSSEKEAEVVGARVKKAISNCVIPIGEKSLSLALNMGVTDVYPTDDSESMLARAFQKVDTTKRKKPVGAN